jgi:D-alanyl-D-alanine carboxypeptidase
MPSPPRPCVFARRHAVFRVHFAHARRPLSVLFATALLVGGCVPAVQVEPVSTTSPTPAPEPLTIGQAATDTYGGWIPDGQTLSPFDVANPALAQLDPPLLNAIQDAARAATAQGVDLRITSGWRSKGFQQRLFDDAVGKYGSVDIARQFVASPDVSKHVAGQAVDVAPVDADKWLIRNGAQFGLCQIYANEVWHFELAVDQHGNCPPLRPNAAG